MSAPSVIIDNEVIAIVPNSFKFNLGLGAKNVRVASSGGDATEIVSTDNVEEKKGKASFSIISDPEKLQDIVQKLKTWGKGKHVIQGINNFGFEITIAEARLVTSPDIETGADSVIELEWEGKEAI